MKIVIISDSHNNLANLKHVMGFAKKIDAQAVIHCGDWNDLKSVDTVFSYKIPVYGVVGNADIADNIKDKFNKFLEIKIDNKKIAIIHSIKDLKSNNYDIVFCGHRHKQQKNGNVVNPGALENDINFAVYDTITGKIEFFND